MNKLSKTRPGNVRERCRRTFRGVAAATVLAVASLMPMRTAHAEAAAEPEAVCEQAEEEGATGWFAFRPGYVIGANQLMLKIEGGMSAPTGTSMYGFAEIRPSEEDSASLDSLYSEMRVMQRLYRGLRLYAELDFGSGLEPIVRPGLIYVASVGGWNIMPRISPWSFGGAGEVQFSIYLNRAFGERIFTEFLIDMNFIQATIYAEVAADVLMPRGFSVGLFVSVFSDLRIGEASVTPIVRAGASF
ncbi:MAG: hypothetical protein ABII71_02390 [Candidatus Micrarchaeota archaeon]